MVNKILVLTLLICSFYIVGCRSGHEHSHENIVKHYDTTYQMINAGFTIDLLDSIPNKPFAFINTNIDSVLICNQSFWDENISPLEYVQDSLKTNLDYSDDEGNQYAMINKTELDSVNLVVLGRNSFSGKNIEYFDLLITDKANSPIFFCHLGSLSRGLKLSRADLSDTTIMIQLKGEEFEDGFVEGEEMSIKVNHQKSMIYYSRSWYMRGE